MSAPLVTILTAVRNGAAHIASTIECALKQSVTDWEYIIVDDASTDETVKTVEAFCRQDSRIHLLRRPTSGGPYVAANTGLRAARGKYIVRTDADDHFPVERVAKQLEFLAKNPDCRACVSYWQGFNDGGVIPRTVPVPSNSRVFRWALLLRAPSLHSAVCYERLAMEELGGYRELPLAQDYRLWCELTRRNWLGTIPEVLCYVRYHEKRQTHTNATLQLELGLDVLSDHLFELTGEKWSRDDLAALRFVGLSERMPVARGLEMLDRWDRFWQAATDLAPQDRQELARISAFRRWKHLRANARTQPATALTALLKLTVTKSQFLVPALREVH
jgi:glycosyltransferase involved in cell wall biosynthesis